MDDRTIHRIRREAEDGLDPKDALTPEEALARIVYILAFEEDVTTESGYHRDTALYEHLVTILPDADHHKVDRWSAPILGLLDWGHGQTELRPALENADYIARWV